MSIYNGCQNKDVDGKDCLTWTEAVIVVRDKPDEYLKWDIPVGLLDNNYCRNAKLDDKGLSCYIWKDATNTDVE